MSTQQQQLAIHTEPPPADHRPAHDARGMMTRRQVAAYAALLLGSLASGCTGMRALTKWFPHPCEEHADLVLRAFVATVIPGVPLGDPNLLPTGPIAKRKPRSMKAPSLLSAREESGPNNGV